VDNHWHADDSAAPALRWAADWSQRDQFHQGQGSALNFPRVRESRPGGRKVKK